jgi:hypothetical protein
MTLAPCPQRSPVEASDLVATMRRYGGDWQPLLREFSDAVAALDLPDTGWAVLSCPIDGMDLDPDFVAQIDRDGDGRVRADDVREAVRWTVSMLADWHGVTEGSDALRLRGLSEGAAGHRATALALAEAIGAGDDPRLTLADLRNTEALCQCGDRDGDGVVPVDCMAPDLQAAATDILAVCPPETDRNGKPGVTKSVLDAFARARDDYLAWAAAGEAHRRWGDASLELAMLVLRCDASVRAWFALCELACVVPDKAAELDAIDTAGVAARDPEAVRRMLDALPLAPPRADGALHFDAVRPGALREPLQRLRDALFDGDEVVTAAAWAERVQVAQGVKAWHDEGAALSAGVLGAERLAVFDGDVLGRLHELCELDERNKRYFAHLQELEKLLVYQRDLFRFCRNFIAFTDLMDPERRALFERGSLVMAGREFHFAMRVRDMKRHKQRAEESGIFVLYVQVSYRWRIEDEPTLETVAIPVTRGTSEGLRLHRRGIFVDRGGRCHEAVVIDLVENPVSLAEALLAPFGRVGQYLSGKLEKLSEKLEGDFDKRVADISKAPPAPAPAPAPGPGINPLMGGTLAFAALGSAFAFITKQLTEIGGPRILLALVVVSVLVTVPTVLLAGVRLYRRNLAGLISASDWALNDRMRLTASLGRLFTRRPLLPAAVTAQTRDLALEQLRRVDPTAVLRERVTMIVRGTTVATMTVLLLTIALPASRLPWLDLATWGAGGVHVLLLLGVLVGFTLKRRFRAVYWWPVLTSFPAAILIIVYYLTNHA